MRTVVAFGGEFRELTKFQAAVVQAKRGATHRAGRGKVLPPGLLEVGGFSTKKWGNIGDFKGFHVIYR